MKEKTMILHIIKKCASVKTQIAMVLVSKLRVIPSKLKVQANTILSLEYT